MININNVIHVPYALDLSKQVHQALTVVNEALAKRYGDEPVKVNWKGPFGFQFLFGARNISPTVEFDLDFISSAYNFTQMSSRNEFFQEFVDLMSKYESRIFPSIAACGSIKRGLKMLLVQLHAQGAIILPSLFETGAHFIPATEENELLKFISSFRVDDSGMQLSTSATPDELARRVFYYMPRIIRSTDWKKIEDFNIFDFAKMHAAQVRSVKSGDRIFTTAVSVPWILFLDVLLEHYPSRVSYSAEQVEKYSAWVLKGVEIDSQSFETYFLMEHAQSEPLPKKRKDRTPKIEREKRSEKLKRELDQFSDSSKHENAIGYSERYVPGPSERNYLDAQDEFPVYPGREHVDVRAIASQWLRVIRAYRYYRRNKQYESDSADASLGILCDYLFLYLPWWIEISRFAKVKFPLTPKEFGRYAFVSRDEEVSIDELPICFIDFIKLRRKGAHTQYSAIIDIELFFDFVGDYYSEDDEIAGSRFKNPVRRKFDAPPVKRPGKTTKVVFSKKAYRYLVKYAYAVEAVGEHIQKSCASGNISLSRAKKIKMKDDVICKEIGFVPYIYIDGKTRAIKSVPNIFTWATRTFDIDGAVRDIFMPHLTTHRALITAIETGLRMASIRWLDRRTWNNLNANYSDLGEYNSSPGQYPYVYALLVNTDKTQDGFNTEIVHRVHSMFLREQYFQNKIAEPNMMLPVDYMKREHSRFDQVVPLFRSASSPNPISEDYFEKWAYFLSGFEEFYQSVTGELSDFVVRKEYVDKNGKTEIKISAINTPHSCRATFATNREGLMDVEDIANAIGHTDPNVTRYYQSPRAEDLKAKLESSDRLMHDWENFDKDSVTHIRADKEGSALVKSFRKDPNGTMKRFSFMPPVMSWTMSDKSTLTIEEIDRLRNGPMASMQFMPTHICPVGMQCPSEVIKATGEPGRCGMCPLAMKCIDHLTAISAKKNSLVSRVRYNMACAEELNNIGETQAADDLYNQIEMDTNELLAWQFAEEVLLKMLSERQDRSDNSDEVIFLVEQPEIVRRHLRCFVKPSKPTEFVLDRIADGNAYPSLQTPELRATAALLRKRIVAGRSTDNFVTDFGDFTAVSEVASMLKSVMRTHGLSVDEVGKHLIEAVPRADGVSFLIDGTL
jgi:hypothetical protein